MVFPKIGVLINWIAIALDVSGGQKFSISTVELSVRSRFDVSPVVLIEVIKLIIQEKFLASWNVFFKFNDICVVSCW